MDEKKDKIQEEEYQVIQEKIIPKKKQPNYKRIGKGVLRAVIYGGLFGIVAAVALVFVGRFLFEKMGLEDAFRQMVAIGSTTPTPKPVPTNVPTKAPTGTVTVAPTGTKTPSPSGTETTPEATPQVTVTIDSSSIETPVDTLEQKEIIQNFLNIYSGVTELSRNLERSLVQVTAVEMSADWFEEAYEIRKNATGLYVADNGVDMLFLLSLDSVEGATKFEIKLANGKTVPASIFSYDTNYRIVVLSVRLSAMADVEEDVLPEKAVFALDDVEAGIPVVILGNPNGHAGAMELGMTTGVNQVVPVDDDEVLYFTTGITRYADGDGFAFNLSGEVIGIVSGSLNNGESGVFTAAMISGMREIIDKTLNKQPRIYCGLRLETVDEQVRGDYNLPDGGVYVTEVLPSSPAIAAGLKNGDIILQIGETPITGVRQFYEVISAEGTDDSVRVTLSREMQGGWKKISLYMTPEERMH
ncbi:MAG: serine protease [Lachnospiraceae bacterium]|nr:serine protease [Lachnospiraceae bacterium]